MAVLLGQRRPHGLAHPFPCGFFPSSEASGFPKHYPHSCIDSLTWLLLSAYDVPGPSWELREQNTVCSLR